MNSEDSRISSAVTPSPSNAQPVSRRRKAALLVLAVLLVAAADLTFTSGTHPLHAVHVAFAGLYLIPIVAGALWFGLAGGLLTAVGVAAAYVIHIGISGPEGQAETSNEYAMIGVHLVVGVASGVLVRRQEHERRRRIVQAIASLASALGHRDEYTRGHSERVSRLAVEIGKRRGLSAERLEVLRLASLMHDLGKIGVRDDVLLKPHPLSSEERVRIERHPVLAAEILRPLEGTAEIAEIVLSHHECPDGSGYPRGLRGDEIPLEARILRVADVYSALTDARVYKPGMDVNQAIVSILEMSGTKLDAEAVQALRSIVGERSTRARSSTETSAERSSEEE